MVLQRCEASNVTMSLKKLEIGSSVNFSGFRVGCNGVQPSKERTDAIRKFPVPTCRKKLKSFLGLSQTLAGFVPDYAHVSCVLTELTKERIAWNWLESHQRSFDDVRKMLTSDLVLKGFDPARDTELVTDASRVGLGFVLQQRDPSTMEWHMVSCGSRKLTDVEGRWAVCELEGLGILFAVQKCRFFVLGMHFTVITDHAPLRGIWRKDLIDVENPRLRRIREKLSEYNFELIWIEGHRNRVADALSRAPVWDPDPSTSDPEFTDICRAISASDMDSLLLPLVAAADADADYQAIIKALGQYESARQLPKTHPGLGYRSRWTRMSLDPELNLILLDGLRILVPMACRGEVLDRLHEAHCGNTLTSKLAKKLYFWSGMNNACLQLSKGCDACVELLPSQGQESLITTVGDGPMSHVSVDLFEIGPKKYVAMADRWSAYVWCERLSRMTADSVIGVLRSWFWEEGKPRFLRSDGGPCFDSFDFREFCAANAVTHEMSTAYHHESNGHAEVNVKKVKKL